MSTLRPRARVARGATYLFIQGFGNAAIGLIYFSFLAHTFQDPSEQWQMGAFALLSFILTSGQTFGTFALASAAVKYIAQYVGENRLDKAKAVVVRVLQIGLLASAVAFFALFVPAEWLSTMLFGTATNALLIRMVAVCSIFAILYTQATSFLLGLQRMRDVSLIGLSYTFISTAVGIYLLFSGWRLLAVVTGWLVGYAIACIACLTLTARCLGVFGKPFPIRPLLNFSFPLYVSGIIGFFVGWVDQLLLVSYMSSLYGVTKAQAILGIYNVAIRASIVPTLFSTSVVAALFPQLTELYARQGHDTLKDAFRVSVRYSMLIGFPLIIGLATLAYPIVILFGGWQYIGAVEPLIVISVAALIGTFGVAVNPILYTMERTATASVLSFVLVILSFALSYIALVFLNLGMIGTAFGRSIAAIAVLILSLYVIKRYVPISIDRETLWKASSASAVMVLAIFALDSVRMFLSPDSNQFLVIRSPALLPIYVLVGGLAYFSSLAALKALKRHDVELVHEYMPKKLKRYVPKRLKLIVALLERVSVAD